MATPRGVRRSEAKVDIGSPRERIRPDHEVSPPALLSYRLTAAATGQAQEWIVLVAGAKGSPSSPQESASGALSVRYVLDVRAQTPDTQCMEAAHFESYGAARARFKELLDAARRGRPATVRRKDGRAAVVDAERLRRFLTSVSPVRAQVVAEAGRWSVVFPGVPVAADGATVDEALDEAVDALREYAADWQEYLLDVPNHRDNWSLVQLITLSDDDQLRSWISGSE